MAKRKPASRQAHGKLEERSSPPPHPKGWRAFLRGLRGGPLRGWRALTWVGIAALVAWIPVAVVLLVREDEGLPAPRIFEMVAEAQGCRPKSLEVQPGERIRFLLANRTDAAVELLVSDEAGVDLRTSPGYDPDQISERTAPVSGGWSHSKENSGVFAAGFPWPLKLAAFVPAPSSDLAGGRFGALRGSEAQFAHDGHEDEKGPNANADFPYRLVVSDNGVRHMVVTFPETGEDLPRLSRFVCAPLASDGSLSEPLSVGAITGSGGR